MTGTHRCTKVVAATDSEQKNKRKQMMCPPDRAYVQAHTHSQVCTAEVIEKKKSQALAKPRNLHKKQKVETEAVANVLPRWTLLPP